MSLLSAAGCDFIDLNIGFNPSSTVWNQSDANLGFFFYQGEGSSGNMYLDLLQPGCKWYPEQFEEIFMASDQTWTVSRIIALVAGASSLFAVIVSWLVVFTNCPANCIWPGLLLPAVTIFFLAEGSKFLLFDVSLCGNPRWVPPGDNSLPQTAESCTLGQSAILCIAATSLALVSLLMVCLHVTEKRALDPEYGIHYTTSSNSYDDDEEEEEEDTLAQQGDDLSEPSPPYNEEKNVIDMSSTLSSLSQQQRRADLEANMSANMSENMSEGEEINIIETTDTENKEVSPAVTTDQAEVSPAVTDQADSIVEPPTEKAELAEEHQSTKEGQKPGNFWTPLSDALACLSVAEAKSSGNDLTSTEK